MKILKVIIFIVFFIIIYTIGIIMFSILPANATETICGRNDVMLCEDWEGSNWVSNPKDTSTGWGTGTQSWQPSSTESLVTTGAISGFGYNSNRSLKFVVAEYPCSVCVPDRRESGTAPHSINPPIPVTTNGVGNVVHMRFYIYFSPGFLWVPEGSGMKIGYFVSWLSGQCAWRTRISMDQNGVNTSQGRLQVDVMTGASIANCQNVEDIAYLPNVTTTPITSGAWHLIEVRIKMNTPGTPPVANGEFTTWVDNVMNHQYTGKYINGYSSNPLNAMNFSAYYGGSGESNVLSHNRQYLYYDNAVIATQYIGPVITVLAPSKPSNLRMQ